MNTYLIGTAMVAATVVLVFAGNARADDVVRIHGMVCDTQGDVQAAWDISDSDRSASEQEAVDKVNLKLGKVSCKDGDFYATIGETVGEVTHGDIHGAIRRLSITQECRDGLCVWSSPHEAYGAFPLQGNYI